MISNKQLEWNTINSFEFVKEDIDKIFRQLEMIQKEVKILKEHQRFIMQEIMDLNSRLIDNEIMKS